MEEVAQSSAMVLTENEKDTLQLEGKTITVLPIYKWLLV